MVYAVDKDRRGAATRLMLSSTRRSDLSFGWKDLNNTTAITRKSYIDVWLRGIDYSFIISHVAMALAMLCVHNAFP